MPRREVGQVRFDHFGGVMKFLFGRAGGLKCLDVIDNSSPVAPAVEVSAVSGQHLAYETKLLDPKSKC